MKKLLYIDACIRGEISRTRRVAEPIVEALKDRYEVETLTLNDLELDVVKKDLVEQRCAGNHGEKARTWARKVRDADRIVIAAPFRDMSFPAALKVFLELCSIVDITFSAGPDRCYGNCRAEKLLYITTRGMNFATGDPLEQATPYLKAISWLWGIDQLQVVAAWNMDYVSEEAWDEKIRTAVREGLEIAKDF